LIVSLELSKTFQIMFLKEGSHRARSTFLISRNSLEMVVNNDLST
jgi:hypothetical protein